MSLTLQEAYERLNLSVDLVPVGRRNRPGTRLTPTYITIHNTANNSNGADADSHARWIKNTGYYTLPSGRRNYVSWHYTVDDGQVVKSLPTTEQGWHAGSGNAVSIGIEICQNRDGDREDAHDRAALLVAVLMKALNIPAANVVPHKHWTGKHCPAVILDGEGFSAFRQRCSVYRSELIDTPGGMMPGDIFSMADGLSQLIDSDVPETPTVLEMPQPSIERAVGRLYLEKEWLAEQLHRTDTEPEDSHDAALLDSEPGYEEGDDISDAEIDELAAGLSDADLMVHVCTERDFAAEEAQYEDSIRGALAERPENRVPLGGERDTLAAVSRMPMPSIAFVYTRLWRPGRNLRIRFMDEPTDYVRERIMRYAKAWEEEANINLRFVFGTDPEAEIRIGLARGGSWSALGTDALLRGRNQATMNYGWFDDSTDDEEFARTTIHEFGHALGAIHEHQNPRGNAIPWNKPAVYAYYRQTQGWTKQQVDFNLFQKYAVTQVNASRYDRRSIMHYAVPKEHVLNPQFAVGWNRELSPSDILFAQTQYP
ncbi:MAG: N-acetylmuramoyl-L-alanine amidase [Armatimonadetes bacterium]|nr:N-acetylmuramoyl-L-alanine amidase [Armatimonadota bacterium]